MNQHVGVSILSTHQCVNTEIPTVSL